MHEQCRIIITINDKVSAIIERSDSVFIVDFDFDRTISISKYSYPIEPYPIFTRSYHSLGEVLQDTKLDKIVYWVTRGVIGTPNKNSG